MEYAVQLLLFIIYITISSYAAEFVQNPDFEIPPANLTTANATAGANSVPGWSVNGTVWYVPLTSSSGGGHAVQLGPNGKIGQTIRATAGDDVLHYILSFTVGAQNGDCANNLTALNLTLHDSWDTYASKLFYMQKNSTRNLWERHALFLGQLGRGDYVHLQIESVATKSQHNNVTCWPLVDAFTVNTNFLPRWYNGNWMSNGGFEVGPAFLKNSTDGIILTSEEEKMESSLQQWSILGTIRYIDSRHYRVPRGEAAVELLTGDPSGVRADFTSLPNKYTYTLNFTVGDANDSCVGDFTVHVQVGSSAVYNFTMHSNGTGSAFKQSLKFKLDEESSSRETSLTFYTFEEARTRDGLLCGPVLDSVFLAGSDGERVRLCICNGILVLVFSFFLLL